MKRFILSVAIFLAAFIISYIGLCYLIPGWRIRLAADETTYFIESIRHMIFLKSIISFVIGAVLAGILFLVNRLYSQGTQLPSSIIKIYGDDIVDRIANNQ